MIDFSNYRFRCSSLGALMSDSKEKITDNQLEKIEELKKKPKLTDNQVKEFNRLIQKRDNPANVLGATCIDKLVEIYIQEVYSRIKPIYSKYLEKGVHAEEDSLTVYSLIKSTYYEKNTIRLYNQFLTGLPDTFEGRAIDDADVVIDTKTMWDIHTFYAAKAKPANTNYVYQLHGYFPLTGAKVGKIANCLVNTPGHLIRAEKMKVFYSLNAPDESNDPGAYEKYHDACIDIEKQMIFDMAQFRRDNPYFDIDCQDWRYDIPLHQRVHEIIVERNEQLITDINDRAKLCRIWLNNFARKECKNLNAVAA